MERFVINKDDDAKEEILPELAKPCELCFKVTASYTCPRCKVLYCGLTCYKGDKHGACSEEFYKEEVFHEIENQDRDPEDKRKVLQMIARVEQQQLEEQEEELESEDDLHERMKNFDLDDDFEKMWENLTEEERTDFERAIQDGRLSNMIEVWVPWWENEICDLSFSKSKIVTIGDDVVDDTNKIHLKIDEMKKMSNIKLISAPGFENLNKSGKISPLLPYHLLCILYSYCYSCRLFNGELLLDGEAALQCFLECSLVMLVDIKKNGSVVSSLNECGATIRALLNNIQQTQFKQSIEFSSSIINDVCNLCFSHKIIFALSEIIALFRWNIKQCEDPNDKKMLKLKQKKIGFFLSWIQSSIQQIPNDPLTEQLNLFRSILGKEYQNKIEELRNLADNSAAVNEIRGKVCDEKKLIEEL